ncbi:peptide ABC transporter substrate-binding protein [Thermanaerosceptrum fracticalcis]|jgi:oligopeptide transport system substrate-binding protein|nr:peptide ABC transporter substrate-binding protein [Thermanaerosceptrum fracticalcis]
MKNKLVVFVLVLSLMVTLVAGCGSDKKPQAEAPKEQPKSQVQGKFIRHNHGQEPETIDPALNTTVNGGTIILSAFEGLTTLDENDNPAPGVAEKWDISPDKTKYTFYLRKNAKWSDGKPVTANDFYYAWKRALNPKTAAEYAYQLFYIKNAEEFNSDKTGKVNFEDVGIKVKDDYTLEVQLKSPTPFWLKLTAFPTLAPVREDIITKYGDKWALSPESYIGNGPFKMVEWKSKDMMKFVKNEHYWNKDAIKIDGYIETFIAEASTMLSAFEAGEVDVIDEVPLEEIPRLKKESKEFKILPQLGTYYYCFNVKKAPFNNLKVRKAFALAIDREDIVDKVRKSGIPATAFVPPGVPDAEPGKDFRTVGGAFFPIKAQPEEAKKLLAEAGYPEGKGLPPITLIYNTNEGHKKIAEAALEMFKKNLGISNITLTNQEWAVFVNTRQKGDFQIARHGWLGDYNDPMTFIDLFTTGNGNNDAQWSNKEFDKLIQKARLAANEKERMEILHKAEKLFLDDVIMIPIFHYTENTMIKSYIKNLHKSPLGFTYFDKAEIVK